MLSANHVLSPYECGQKEKLKALDLVCQWCGENRKTTFDDCYFCMVDLKCFNRHKKKSWIYPDLESARRPVPRPPRERRPFACDMTSLDVVTDRFTSRYTLGKSEKLKSA